MNKAPVLLLALAACSPAPERDEAAVTAPIECALTGSAKFGAGCSLARAERADGAVLTVSGPDGSFRRLLVAPDGSIAAADGALPAHVTGRTDAYTEVTIASDRYRIPASGSPPPP